MLQLLYSIVYIRGPQPPGPWPTTAGVPNTLALACSKLGHVSDGQTRSCEAPLVQVAGKCVCFTWMEAPFMWILGPSPQARSSTCLSREGFRLALFVRVGCAHTNGAVQTCLPLIPLPSPPQAGPPRWKGRGLLVYIITLSLLWLPYFPTWKSMGRVPSWTYPLGSKLQPAGKNNWALKDSISYIYPMVIL